MILNLSSVQCIFGRNKFLKFNNNYSRTLQNSYSTAFIKREYVTQFIFYNGRTLSD